ncbi:myosin-X-like protein [Cricetulus griseus]|uniref:Myosin-X-like protein n=1 Tax=Cricetulus griseus TaxID=10029 RepID=A0A061IK36_CRIGR|nr:myosin-X-like protein [Cricetulus griseus]
MPGRATRARPGACASREGKLCGSLLKPHSLRRPRISDEMGSSGSCFDCHNVFGTKGASVVILEQFPEEFVNMKTIMIVGTDVGKDRWYMVDLDAFLRFWMDPHIVWIFESLTFHSEFKFSHLECVVNIHMRKYACGGQNLVQNLSLTVEAYSWLDCLGTRVWLRENGQHFPSTVNSCAEGVVVFQTDYGQVDLGVWEFGKDTRHLKAVCSMGIAVAQFSCLPESICPNSFGTTLTFSAVAVNCGHSLCHVNPLLALSADVAEIIP